MARHSNTGKQKKSVGPTAERPNDRLCDVTPEAQKNLLWSIYLLNQTIHLKRMRFRSQPGISFPCREVAAVNKPDGQTGGFYEIMTHVGGMDGVSGPLPIWFSEILCREDPEHAPVGRFLDIFSHRFIESLYLAWERRSPVLAYRSRGRDKVSKILYSLVGINQSDSHSNDPPINKPLSTRMLAYVGNLGHRSSSAEGLEGMLRDYFVGIPISIKEFVRRHITLPLEDRSQLDRERLTLGTNMILGDSVEDVTSTFCIQAGPLKLKSFMEFLPDGKKFSDLVELVKMYVGRFLLWELVLILKADSVPGSRLGQSRPCLQLGRNMWLTSPWYQVTDACLHFLRKVGVPEDSISRLKRKSKLRFSDESDFLDCLNPIIGNACVMEHRPSILRHAFQPLNQQDVTIILQPNG
jgi:type VI secretion system protein ImpH